MNEGCKAWIIFGLFIFGSCLFTPTSKACYNKECPPGWGSICCPNSTDVCSMNGGKHCASSPNPCQEGYQRCGDSYVCCPPSPLFSCMGNAPPYCLINCPGLAVCGNPTNTGSICCGNAKMCQKNPQELWDCGCPEGQFVCGDASKDPNAICCPDTGQYECGTTNGKPSCSCLNPCNDACCPKGQICMTDNDGNHQCLVPTKCGDTSYNPLTQACCDGQIVPGVTTMTLSCHSDCDCLYVNVGSSSDAIYSHHGIVTFKPAICPGLPLSVSKDKNHNCNMFVGASGQGTSKQNGTVNCSCN